MSLDRLVSSFLNAIGESRSVVAVFIDVRGFTEFAGINESVDAATFLRKLYVAVLRDFLPSAAFAKPTGDGLMVILEYDEHTVASVVEAAVGGSIALLHQYPDFLSNDPMITFELPPHIGIGLARGAATCLSTGDGILDYSGRPLNLAARLMNLARPRGVVIDGAVTHGLAFPQDEGFVEASIAIRGIAEGAPRTVLLREEWTSMPESARRP